MVPRINDMDPVTGPGQFPRNHGARKACSDDPDCVAAHHLPLH
jgi:hypothetical protein